MLGQVVGGQAEGTMLGTTGASTVGHCCNVSHHLGGGVGMVLPRPWQ